ncbi:ARM repeat-containing protein, partial [Rozella allomycis CSF55]
MDLSLLLSPNNQEREASEKQLEQFIKQDGNGAMKSLVETMVVCGDSAIRGLAAVLIRRFIIQRKIKWKELSEETRGGVLEGFNHSLENERVGDVQKKVADSAAEVYRSVKKSGAVEFISGLFEHGMMNAEANVRFEALKSYVETFGSVSTRMRKGMYGPMKIVGRVLGSLVEEESMLNESMTCLIEFIPKFSKATKMIYGELYKFVVSLLGKEDVDDEVKQSGMEMIVTIAESIPEVIDKDEEFLRVVIPNVLKMFLSVEEGEEWYKSDSDDDLNDVGSFAESGLDRLALSLDSNKMMVVLGEYLNGMFGSKVWQERYGGLMTIFSVAEGCHELMVERFEDVLKMVLVLINDESARVRYAVGSVLGQLSSDFSEKAQGEYFGLIVEALIHLMSDKVDKVKGRGVEAMVNLLDGVEKKQVVNYSDRIMSVIFELIKINDYIKTACLDVIVSIAESLKEEFVKYYEIIPILYNLFDSVKIVEYKDKEVCGKILNSISSIYNECEGEGGKKGVNGS